MEAGRHRTDTVARPIEEGRTMTQKEYTVTIHGNRMWRRMQEEAARRKRRGRIIQGVHCLLTAALARAAVRLPGGEGAGAAAGAGGRAAEHGGDAEHHLHLSPAGDYNRAGGQ